MSAQTAPGRGFVPPSSPRTWAPCDLLSALAGPAGSAAIALQGPWGTACGNRQRCGARRMRFAAPHARRCAALAWRARPRSRMAALGAAAKPCAQARQRMPLPAFAWRIQRTMNTTWRAVRPSMRALGACRGAPCAAPAAPAQRNLTTRALSHMRPSYPHTPTASKNKFEKVKALHHPQ